MSDNSPYMYAMTADPDKPLREARKEIERLTAERDEAKRGLLFAAGVVSTMPQYQTMHPEQVLKMLERAAASANIETPAHCENPNRGGKENGK